MSKTSQVTSNFGLQNTMGKNQLFDMEAKEKVQSQILIKEKTMLSSHDYKMMIFWQFLEMSNIVNSYPELKELNENNINFYPPPSIFVKITKNNYMIIFQLNVEQMEQVYDKDIDGYGKFNQFYFPSTHNLQINHQDIVENYSYRDHDRQIMLQISKVYARSIGKLMQGFNDVVKEENFVSAFVKKHSQIVKQLPQAYKEVGFANANGEMFAHLQILQNMIKRSNINDYFTQIFGTEDEQQKHDDILQEYFNQTNSYILEHNNLFVVKNFKAALSELQIFRSKVESGEVGEPSLQLNFTSSGSNEGLNNSAINELKQWFEDEESCFGELIFIFIKSHSFKLTNEFSILLESLKGKYDAITIDGTIHLYQQSLAKNDKFVDQLLKSILRYRQEQHQSIQKIVLKRCFISHKTFSLLGKVIENCRNLKEIDISEIQLGNYVESKIRTINSKKEVKCREYCCGECCVNFKFKQFICFCCPFDSCKLYKQDTTKLIQEINENVQLHQQNILETVEEVDFSDIINSLKKNETFLNTFIANGINFNHLSQPEQVNKFLSAIATTKPFAVNFQNCSFSDRHITGIVDLLLKNDRLMHFDISQNLFKDSLQILDKLIRSMPFLISAKFTWVDKKIFTQLNFNPPALEVKEEDTYCCCFPIKRLHFEQQKFSQQIQFPITKLTNEESDLDNIKNFETSIKEEVRKHRLITYSYFLSFLAPGESLLMKRKRKKLQNYIEAYYPLLKKEIFKDNKIQLVADWREEVKQLFQKENNHNMEEINDINLDTWMKEFYDEQLKIQEVENKYMQVEKDFREKKEQQTAENLQVEEEQ